MRLIRGEGKGPPSMPMTAKDVAAYNEGVLRAHRQVDEVLDELWKLLALAPFPSCGLVRPRDVRRILGLSVGQLRGLVARKRIRTVTIGGLRRFPRVDVLRLLMEEWRSEPSLIKPSKRHLRGV
ncbi:MAG: helix-turn-helix domain-containing protein [Archangium sp.]|nr:helix-turn-helix domain-containing protein [Archangium sp.]